MTAFPKVSGRCPEGCGETLFLGDGGHVTCSLDRCPDPGAASDLLSRADGSTACEICGSHDDARPRGWHDDGDPMPTCAKCGGPAEEGAA